MDLNALRSWHESHSGDRALVCVQGLGFVGAAMAVAVARAARPDGSPWFDVVGVDLDNEPGRERVAALAGGAFPFAASDPKLATEAAAAVERGNLTATTDAAAYSLASVVLVDVNLDVIDRDGVPGFVEEAFRSALRAVGSSMREDALVIVETTVPPGTCERVAAPELAAVLRARGLPDDRFLLAHAYERVMPGENYLDSIVNFWRVYSGRTPRAADACEAFLSRVVNTRDYPLTRLGSTTASETAKVLENSYRAVTIAFMEEWGRFAEAAGIDMFEIVSAIRMRPTHSNMRTPGLGVGGYCLTKDPLFGAIAARDLFDLPDLDFAFSTRAVAVNQDSPRHAVDRLDELLGGLGGKRVLLLGIAYRPGVGDTRYSPSQTFYEEAARRGARVTAHDPVATDWPEVGAPVISELPSSEGFDAVVFAVGHREYEGIDFVSWLDGRRPAILDSNGILGPEARRALREAGCRVASVGRGDES